MNQRGFALPITIFLIAILTLMLGSTFTRAATENQIAAGSKWTVDALFVAQAGLEKYFSQDFEASDRPLPEDSMRLEMPGGWAWVVPNVLITPADTMQDFRYIIRSTGYVEDPSQPGHALASHTVAQFADWQTAWLDAPRAALIAANGLDIESANVTLDGRDRLNALCAGDPLLPDGFGARLPASTYNRDLDDADFSGEPDPDGFLELGARESVAQLVNIDWEAIRAGEFIPDYTSPQNGLTGDFPSQLVDGNYTETRDNFSGEGLLIVTGDLTVSSSRVYWYWRGVILVGGEASIEADEVYIFGTLISGLNYLTGDTPTNDDSDFRGDDGFLLRFDSCNIRKSLGSMKGFVPLENTWIDNWATF
jgi:hypothetical protein